MSKAKKSHELPLDSATELFLAAFDAIVEAESALHLAMSISARSEQQRLSLRQETDKIIRAKKGLMRKALKAGASCDKQLHGGRTGRAACALILLVINGENDLAKMVLPHANLDLVDVDGVGALHWACYQNQPELVKMLLDRDSSLAGRVDKKGLTPLHWCAKGDSVGCAEMLMGKGANANAQDVEGRTPMILACRVGNEGFANYMAPLCNLDVKDSQGRSAFNHILAGLAGPRPVDAVSRIKAQLERGILFSVAVAAGVGSGPRVATAARRL